MKPVAPLTVFPESSRRLALIVLVAHCVAAGAVLLAAIPAWLAVLLLIMIGASLAFQRRLSPVAGLILRGDGRMEIVGADGTANETTLHLHSVVLSFLVVLLYRQQGRLRALTLLADSLPAEDFRQLRLWLRWRSSVANPV